MLKKIRIVVAVVILTIISFYFIDFTGLLSDNLRFLAKIQLIPALLALNIGVLLFLTLLTLFFGRVYCSTLCPMGIFQDVVTWFAKLTSKKKRKKGFTYSKAKNKLRYSVLGISILLLLLHFIPFLSIIEPYSAYGRMVTHLFKPAVIAGNNLLAGWSATTETYYFTKHPIWVQSIAALSTAIGTLLIISFLSWKYGRTYCNTLCPAGTLLGSISKYARFKVQFDTNLCGSCGLCERKCKASCINAKEKAIDYSRCINCFNCLGSCKKNALSYSYAPLKKKDIDTKVAKKPDNQSRRQFIVTAAVSSVAIPYASAKRKRKKMAASLNNQKAYTQQVPVSPPGSRSHKHFSQHCTSCHLCINRCPQQILKPSLLEYGLGGIMQPVISYEDSYCAPDCTVCSDVCPNGAIRPLTVEKKQHTQIGTAIFVAENCLIHTQQIKCGACARKCPVEAITLIAQENQRATPVVNTDQCIGCGACEYICPATPYRAIYVEGKEVHTFA